jgi:four helix bundle protein
MQYSAGSAPRNIAEGFGRYLPREFSQYLRVANGSLMETSNHLLDGYDRGYFTKAEIEPVNREPMNPVVLIPPSAK